VPGVEWDEIAALIRDGGTPRLATAGADGWPHASQIMVGVEGDHLWFVTGTRSRKARNLRENPRAALVWTPKEEVYLQATAEFVDDQAERRRVWLSGLLPYDPVPFFGSADDLANSFVKLTPVAAVVFAEGEAGVARHRWSAR
jgi:general stress protein 26